MPTQKLYHNLRPGKRGKKTTSQMVVNPEEGILGYLPPYDTRSANHTVLAWLPDNWDYGTTGQYNGTLDNSGSINPRAGGLRWQTAATSTVADGDDTILVSNQQVVLAAGKRVTMWAKIKKSDADDAGFFIGVSTGANTSDYFGTPPSDAVGFRNTKAAATMVGTVIENSNAAEDTGTLATFTDDTYVEIGFSFVAHTTNASNEGFWYVDGTVTPFTAAQLVDLDAMVTTTAPTLNFHAVMRANSTTQRSMVVKYAYLVVED